MIKSFFRNLFKTKGFETGISVVRQNQPTYPSENFWDNSLGGYQKNEVVYSGISEIVTSMAEAPLQALDEEGIPVLTDETIRLLNRPNPHMSSFELWELSLLHLYLSGNIFLFKLKNKRGKVKELWPLRPDRIRIVPSADKFISHYIYQLDGTQHRIAKRDILQFKFSNPTSDLWGMSPIRPAHRQIATDNQATDLSKAMLENGGVPSGILSIPDPLSREARDRIKSQWRQSYGGGNAGEIAVLEGDTKFERIALDMQAMAFADLRNISESRILMCLGVPPILVGAKVGLDRSTYANYEQARLSFYHETISALQRRLTSKLETDKDLNPEGRQFRFDLSAVPAMAGLRQQSFDNAIAGLGAGLLTHDEARAEVGKEPMKKEDAPEAPSEPAEDDNEEKAINTTLDTKQNELDLLKESLGTLQAADRFFDRFEHWAKKEMKRQGKQLSTLMEDTFLAQKDLDDLIMDSTNTAKFLAKAKGLQIIWMTHSVETVAPIMKGLMTEAGRNASANLDVAFDISNAEVLSFVREQTTKFADSVASTSQRQILFAVENAVEKGSTLGELKTDLKSRFGGDLADNRATAIARTETIRAANEGSRAAYKSAGVERMAWLASTDACPYCEGLDGTIVSVEDTFLKKEDHFQPEGATKPLNLSYGDIQVPPAHPSCRCTVTPV